MDPKGRSPRESVVTYSFIVMPQDTNTHETLFGGALVSHIDRTAAMTAMKHCRVPVVTASIDRLDFLAPARVGHFVHLESRVTFVARSSMEIRTLVEAEHPLTGTRWVICEALLTFVGLDEAGRPSAVTPLLPETADEKEWFEAGRDRAERRRSSRRNARTVTGRIGDGTGSGGPSGGGGAP